MQTSLIGKYLKIDDDPSMEIVGVAYDSSDPETPLVTFLLMDSKTRVLSMYVMTNETSDGIRVLSGEQRAQEETS